MRLFVNPNVFNFNPSSDTNFKIKGIKPVPPLFGIEDGKNGPCAKEKGCGQYLPNIGGTVDYTLYDTAGE